MKKIVALFAFTLILFSCKNEITNGNFKLTGELKNTVDQKIYLEELYFSEKPPLVIDTADVKNGQFNFTAIAPQQGLYRIRLEKENAAYIFINDKKNISFTADIKDTTIQSFNFYSSANQSLKNFIVQVDGQQKELSSQSKALDLLKKTKAKDSVVNQAVQKLEQAVEKNNQYITQYIDTASNAILSVFALGYTQNIEPQKLEKSIAGLSKRFPNNDAVTNIIARYNEMMAKKNTPPSTPPAATNNGTAPELNMPDTSGKPFALSSLRGKYVLIDFWASWCGPCRNENPNVVKAFNKFKNKNFTVLGVSLDKDKAAWLNAIHQDNLTWQHISDLKYWGSAAVALYGFDGIPYNVLIDPNGKIIGKALRGDDLENKLTEVLK